MRRAAAIVRFRIFHIQHSYLILRSQKLLPKRKGSKIAVAKKE